MPMRCNSCELMSDVSEPPRRVRRIALHLTRLLLFLLVVVLIHVQHARMSARQADRPLAAIDLDRLRKFFPTAESVGDGTRRSRGTEVFDASGKSLGYVLRTSPDCDQIIGFSGPTNTLIAFSFDNRIVGIDILSSGDTRDHVNQVLKDDSFLKSFNGLTWEQAVAPTRVDGVSGATLTALAIRESVIFRLSGGRPSLRFPDPLAVDDAQQLFEAAAAVEQDAAHTSLWLVKDEHGAEIGSILRSSPHADSIIGYQGPTDTLIGFGPDGRIVGISLGNSYDNAEYVTYVREDEYFLSLFNELALDELARLDLEAAEVEGVSGATMTSMAVTEGMLAAAKQHRQAVAVSAQPRKPTFPWTIRDLGTAVVIIAGLTIALTPLRGMKTLRVCFQLVLIGYLGLVNGDMLSQAMIVGWAQCGVPWTGAGGLVLLTVAAFLVPITTRRNAYCTHLCPHGAAQQLLKHRLRWRPRLRRRLVRTLKFIPALLLLWCVIVAVVPLSFSLVDIEPFDAWVFRVAGWATISIAVGGLAASSFVPMAYCRFGCPTGAMLNFLKFNSRSDRWSRRDWAAMSLVAVAFGIWTMT